MRILYEGLSRSNPEFIEDVNNTFLYLNNIFRHYNSLCSDEAEQFRWLKTDLTYFRFADLIFAYKNKVFAVLVERERKSDDGTSYFGDVEKRYYLLQECRRNNFVPCQFLVYEDKNKSFTGKGFKLMSCIDAYYIDPIKMASDKLAELSDWELKNWSVNLVMNFLQQQGCTITSYNDESGIVPNIWFEDKNGKICWVQVLYATYPDNDKTFSFTKWPPHVLMHDGYKAVVSFANAEDINGKLYRGKGVFVNFRGITQVHSGRTEIHEEVLPPLSKEEFAQKLEELTALEGDLNLPDELLEGRLDMLLILNKFTHYKLTVEELNDSFIFLLNLMCSNQPKLALKINKEDRIRMPFAMLSEIFPTKGKLTREERLIYAYCVFRSCCMTYLDEETNQMRLGISMLIKHPENIIKSLKLYVKQFPERFAFLKTSQASNYPFAVTKQNPVKAISVNDSYKYLRNLMTKDYTPVNFERIGSTEGVNGGIIDGYNLFFMENNQQKTLTIYIDPYSNENSTEAPEGFRLPHNEFIMTHYDEIEELLRLAEQGNAQAQYELGEKFAVGDEVVEDYHAAFKWFMRASKQYHLLAQNAIGIAYVKGLGVKQNYSKAFELFHDAAIRGCSQAHVNWNHYMDEYYRAQGQSGGPTMYF